MWIMDSGCHKMVLEPMMTLFLVGDSVRSYLPRSARLTCLIVSHGALDYTKSYIKNIQAMPWANVWLTTLT